MITINSSRVYAFAFIEGNRAFEFNDQTLEMIINAVGGHECYCAINERLDDVLNLREDEIMPMNFNRNGDAWGYIKRLKTS